MHPYDYWNSPEMRMFIGSARDVAKRQKEMAKNGGVYIEHARNVPLHSDPHYTDQRFVNHERTIFGKKTAHTVYHYSDRLKAADYDKYQKAYRAAGASSTVPQSADFYEALLTAYHGVPCKLYHIMATIDPMTGDSVRIFGYSYTLNS